VRYRILLALAAGLYAQTPGAPQAPSTAQAAAPFDITGYWVSVVNEDWLYRMVTPDKGDYTGVPINAEGRKVADAWDPSKDEAAGNQCKAYGAAAVMRVPGRLHITWQNDNTLRIDTDAGTQTRLFKFVAGAPPGPGQGGDWQGVSTAEWELLRAGRGGGGPVLGGSLKVLTTRMKPGYLRKNGVPYGPNTVLTEYYDRLNEPNGDTWLIVKTIVDNPQYLTQPFITSTNFKKIPDASGWNPSACTAR
jgi:hypothetical protein